MKNINIFIAIFISVFLFGNLTYGFEPGTTDWNLTKKSVLNKIRKGDKPEKETKNELVYKDKVNNLNCYEIFNFENNKLNKITYKFEDFKNIDDCEDLYSKIIGPIQKCHDNMIEGMKKRYKDIGMTDDLINMTLSGIDGYFLCYYDRIDINEECKLHNSITITKTKYAK